MADDERGEPVRMRHQHRSGDVPNSDFRPERGSTAWTDPRFWVQIGSMAVVLIGGFVGIYVKVSAGMAAMQTTAAATQLQVSSIASDVRTLTIDDVQQKEKIQNQQREIDDLKRDIQSIRDEQSQINKMREAYESRAARSRQ